MRFDLAQSVPVNSVAPGGFCDSREPFWIRGFRRRKSFPSYMNKLVEPVQNFFFFHVSENSPPPPRETESFFPPFSFF